MSFSSTASDYHSLATYKLLAACSRLVCRPQHYATIAQIASTLPSWNDIPYAAEKQGIAPLLYFHLSTAKIPIPAQCRQALQGLYLRHRHLNQIRLSILSEILALYQENGIDVLLLKGAALLTLLYPDPGLRPMRDIDILVAPTVAEQAQKLLIDKLGFYLAPSSDPTVLTDHHLRPVCLRVKGLTVTVEIHHRLFEGKVAGPQEMASLHHPWLSFPLQSGELTVHVPNYEDMLWHLCQHMIQDVTVFKPTRLIWIADIISFVEQFTLEINWDRVKGQYPLILNILSLLHHLTPLSADLLNYSQIVVGPAPAAIGSDFQGWPRSSLATQQEKGLVRFFADTFYPPEWWLRLHHGLGADVSLGWHRFIWHPLEITGWIGHYLYRQLFKRK